MRNGVQKEYEEAIEIDSQESQVQASSERDAQRTQCLMYAALLARSGHGVSSAVIFDIMDHTELICDKGEIDKLVAALETLDIDEVISRPLAPVETKPKPEKPEPEPEEEEEEEEINPFGNLFG